MLFVNMYERYLYIMNCSTNDIARWSFKGSLEKEFHFAFNLMDIDDTLELKEYCLLDKKQFENQIKSYQKIDF